MHDYILFYCKGVNKHCSARIKAPSIRDATTLAVTRLNSMTASDPLKTEHGFIGITPLSRLEEWTD